ncbi:MAG: hemerythrin-like domain-containing protein [Halioglobus sp.]|jgi:hemerythrin-like domain-containing protein
MATTTTVNTSKAAPPKKAGSVNKKTGGSKKKPQAAKHRNGPRAISEQPMMKTLRAEHRHMADVLKLFCNQLDALEKGELVDSHVVYEIMDYVTTWPDRFHHPREDLIYSRVAEKNAAAADEVDTLQRDHDHTAKSGRAMLRDIVQWRNGKLEETLVIKNGRKYIDHIHEHMRLEEQLVFPHIEAELTVADWRELTEEDSMQAVSSPIFGPHVQRDYRNLTRKLRRRTRRAVERGVMIEWIGIEAFMESLEVLSIAYDSTRKTAGDHLRTALRESGDFFYDTPLVAPVLATANNARVTFRLLVAVTKISRETISDLSHVNEERKGRMRFLEGKEGNS